MNLVPARVDEAAARRYFTRRTWRNACGLLLPRETVTASGKRLPRIELVWLGYYRIDLATRIGQTSVTQSVSVEGHSGAFALFALHDAMAEGEPAEALFPPAIPEEEAVRIGREETLKNVLRRRSQQKKPAIEETLGVSVFYYPYWVWYFARRGRIDIRLQDAYTGGPGGNRTRSGLLGAFVAARRAKPE